MFVSVQKLRNIEKDVYTSYMKVIVLTFSRFFLRCLYKLHKLNVQIVCYVEYAGAKTCNGIPVRIEGIHNARFDVHTAVMIKYSKTFNITFNITLHSQASKEV